MKLGLAIDLDTCVGCHACAVACKEWNGESLMGGAPDYDAWGKAPTGTWYNRIRHFEIEGDPTYSPHRCGATSETGKHEPLSKTVNVPMSCMHCEEAHCVTVCPTGASYKRAEDGIVLVDPSRCMGCNYCAWACPYGARELDENKGVMKNVRSVLIASSTNNCPKQSGNQRACWLVLRMRGISATTMIRSPRSRFSQKRAAANPCSMIWATNLRTPICHPENPSKSQLNCPSNPVCPTKHVRLSIG